MQRFSFGVAMVVVLLSGLALVGCSSSGQAQGYRDPLAGEPLQRMREAAVAEVNRKEAEARLAGHPPLTAEQRELAIAAVAGEMEADARKNIAHRTASQAVRDSQAGPTDVRKAARDGERELRRRGLHRLTAP